MISNYQYMFLQIEFDVRSIFILWAVRMCGATLLPLAALAARNDRKPLLIYLAITGSSPAF